jgi:hypothetical protein
VVDVGKASAEVSRKYGVPEGHAILTYDFGALHTNKVYLIHIRNWQTIHDFDFIAQVIHCFSRYGVPEGHAILTYDFVLMTIDETSYLRDQKSREATILTL